MIRSQAEQKNVTSRPGLPRVAIIVAMTEDRVIGTGDGLPWHLPDDLQLFKRLTMGCTIIMGRKTYQSIGAPLPGRDNIVLSQSQKELPGVRLCDGFMTGLIAAAQLGHPIFVIGGKELYRKALPIASDLHVSWIKDAVPGDVYFPAFDLTDWVACDDDDFPAFRYVHYHRITSA